MIPKRLVYSSTVTILISFSIFFRKIALIKDVPPLTLLTQFILIASIILNINLLLFQRKYLNKIRNIKCKEWKNTFFAGVFLFSGYLISNYGLRFTTSINYSFLNKSNLIFIPLLHFSFFKKKLPKKKYFLPLLFLSVSTWLLPVGDLSFLILVIY